MTARAVVHISIAGLAALWAAGCSNDMATLSTSSVAPQTVAAPRVDPACAALAAHIDTLKAEGSPERLEKMAAGKSASVQVKRASLAKQAELNRANADFQAKCSLIPRPQTAAVAAPAAVQPVKPTTALGLAQANGAAR